MIFSLLKSQSNSSCYEQILRLQPSSTCCGLTPLMALHHFVLGPLRILLLSFFYCASTSKRWKNSVKLSMWSFACCAHYSRSHSPICLLTVYQSWWARFVRTTTNCKFLCCRPTTLATMSLLHFPCLWWKQVSLSLELLPLIIKLPARAKGVLGFWGDRKSVV